MNYDELDDFEKELARNGSRTTIDGVELVQTCGACPEQYDAYIDGKQVGYLRLRHGHFSVSCPDSGGTDVLSANPNGDGIFQWEERERYLTAAVAAIKVWVRMEAARDKNQDSN